MIQAKQCKGERIREVLTNENFRAIMYTNKDEALLGIYRKKYPMYYPVAVYSLLKFIEQLIIKDNMTEEEAMRYYEEFIANKSEMEDAPIFIDDTGV